MIDSAVILAASSNFANREITISRPHAMLPALGKPMVVRVMERLYRAGIRRYNVILGMNDGHVASYLNRQWMPDATFEFTLQSQETLLLLLHRIAKKLDAPFLIASHNSFTYERFVQSLLRHHEEQPNHLLLAGARLSLSAAKPRVYATVSDEKVSIHREIDTENDHFILGEHMLCGRHCVEYLTQLNESDFSQNGLTFFDVVQAYASQEDAQLAIAETSWLLDVVQDSDLLTLNKRLLEDSNDGHILSELHSSVRVIPPVRVDPQVSVGQ
ncbi:MAG: hypothetical protein KC496_05050, partial [Anaerolineae bacterium]|nr:hypothetical protein [Anaerolineae bacterium]